MNLKQQRTREYQILFCIGSLIGILCFLCVYGVKILDFSYTEWLMNGDMDLRQHFLGWCHFRSSDWHLPIGLIDSLSDPIRVSVIWTDSIPLFAVLFKLFRSVLPEMFQYFGLFGLLCYMLQGGISILLVRRFTASKTVCILSVPFFTLSFTMLQRMYYHTALGAQWLLLLALLLWFYDEWLDTLYKRCAVWFGMGFLCVSIHSYFVPMVGLIMIGSLIDTWMGQRTKQMDTRRSLQTFFMQVLMPASIYCIAAILNLFLLGAFYQDASPVGEGIGAFCSNLNTFINSLGHSSMLGALPVYGEFQYEGFAYLGAGILLLLVRLLVLMVKSLVTRQIKIDKAFFARHRRICLLGLIALVFVTLAVFPTITIGGIRLLGIPYFGPIKTIMNIFRSNGRFIWTPMYLLMLGAIILMIREQRYFPITGRREWKRSSRENGNSAAILLLAVAVLLQIADISGWVREKRAYFAEETHIYESVWDDVKEELAGKAHFVFMYDENDWIMDTAHYAYQHDMTQNNYYYARDYSKQINEEIDKIYQELNQGLIREDTVYIFREQDLEYVSCEKLILIPIDDHVFGIARM